MRVGLALVVLAWFGHYAYVRITTPPGSAEDLRLAEESDGFDPAELDANSIALAEVLSAMPVLTFDEPAPSGMEWLTDDGGTPRVDISDVTSGSWDPAGRTHLRVVVRHLTQPAMTAALEKVTQRRDRPFRMGFPTGVLAPGGPAVGYSELRELAKAIVVRARYHHAELGDLSGAWDDLKTVLLLSQAVQQQYLIDMLVSTACDALALSELQRMCREVEFTEEVAADIERTLCRLSAPTERWPQVMRGESAYVLRILIPCYTNDGQGNGWLVLGNQSWANAGFSGLGFPVPQDRSRLWGIAAPLFNNRRTVEQKVERQFEDLARITNLSYHQVLAHFDRLREDGPGLNILDGPGSVFAVTDADYQTHRRAYQLAVRATAQQRAARIMVALNRYCGLNQRYPEQLDELVPGFLDESPLDPFCEQPFGYHLTDSGDYLLYSCGLDGDDDGGEPGRDASGNVRLFGEEGDLILTQPRREPRSEPQLHPTEEP